MFARQIEEIRRSPALTLYGAALALANVFTDIQFQYRLDVPRMIGLGSAPFCWPFWEECHAILSVSGVNRILWAYLGLSLLAIGFFLARRIPAAYWTLLIANIIRTVVMMQDYRLRANQHYMLNCVVFAYLFLSDKRFIIQHVLASLYFWAGLLKLDREWLSGAALYNAERLWLPAALVPASCVYVVVMETTIVFGLYAQRAWIFWATFAQLILFHIMSWPIVGFWYPALMFCLLAILPLMRIFEPSREWVTWRHLWSRSPRLEGIAAIVILGALQMVPRAFPDSTITGEGRVFALHMFDALVVCEGTMTYHFADGASKTTAMDTDRLPHRVRCDPVIYFDIAKNTCRARSADIADVDLSLRSRHADDAGYRQVIDIHNFCATSPTYDMWRHNAWILN